MLILEVESIIDAGLSSESDAEGDQGAMGDESEIELLVELILVQNRRNELLQYLDEIPSLSIK